jgi:IclR family pca regulon transcriptional regulator
MRLPVHATCTGRILLAGLPEPELASFLSGATLERFTSHTITDPARLGKVVATVRTQGWTLSDQELEVGLRSVAAPITGLDGRTVAAMNVFGSASRVSTDELKDRVLPVLLDTAEQISTSLRRRALVG